MGSQEQNTAPVEETVADAASENAEVPEAVTEETANEEVVEEATAETAE